MNTSSLPLLACSDCHFVYKRPVAYKNENTAKIERCSPTLKEEEYLTLHDINHILHLCVAAPAAPRAAVGAPFKSAPRYVLLRILQPPIVIEIYSPVSCLGLSPACSPTNRSSTQLIPPRTSRGSRVATCCAPPGALLTHPGGRLAAA